MPKLPKSRFGAEAEDGTQFRADVDVDVLTDGTFSVELPETLVACAEKVQQPGAHVGHSRAGARPRVYASSLAAALTLLKKAADDYLAAKTTTVRVICYSTTTDVSFWEEPDGTVAPNGCGRSSKGGWWASKLHGHQFDACHRLSTLAVGVHAKVFDKITTHRPSGDTVRYVKVDPPLHEKHTDPAFLLNSWTVLDVEPKRCREMPYTPEAAQFFHELQVTICKMARGLDAFVSDEKKLKLAIETRANNLLTA